MDMRKLGALSVFRRVIVFAEQPWSILLNVSQGFKDRVTALKAIIQELDTMLGEHSTGVLRNVLEEENHLFYKLEHVYLLPVVRVARAVGRSVPGVKHLVNSLPVRINKENMLATARGVLSASAQHVSLLVANGLPPDFRERLVAAIQAVENRRQLSASERQEAIRITKAIKGLTSRGQQEVACMDPIVRMLCRDDSVQGPETFRAWLTARRLQKISKLGSTPPAGTPTTPSQAEAA